MAKSVDAPVAQPVVEAPKPQPVVEAKPKESFAASITINDDEDLPF